ncbi:hypothetical protein BgiBS90_021758 [Biomphalaria glabrata]|nr:hypothetical protein BgiBS90_021758 [Biomphalaria glabrata]
MNHHTQEMKQLVPNIGLKLLEDLVSTQPQGEQQGLRKKRKKKNMERKRSALAAPLSSPRQSSSEETKWGKKQVARQSQREKNERNLLIQI